MCRTQKGKRMKMFMVIGSLMVVMCLAIRDLWNRHQVRCCWTRLAWIKHDLKCFYNELDELDQERRTFDYRFKAKLWVPRMSHDYYELQMERMKKHRARVVEKISHACSKKSTAEEKLEEALRKQRLEFAELLHEMACMRCAWSA